MCLICLYERWSTWQKKHRTVLFHSCRNILSGSRVPRSGSIMWAHNPEVRGSKPRSARICSFVLKLLWSVNMFPLKAFPSQSFNSIGWIYLIFCFNYLFCKCVLCFFKCVLLSVVVVYLGSCFSHLCNYSKHSHLRTYDFGLRADRVLIYRVLSEKYRYQAENVLQFCFMPTLYITRG